MILPSGRNRMEEMAMADNKLARRPGAQLMPSEPLSPKQQIIVALGMLAIMRGGEYNTETLETFAEGLSKEPFEDVLFVIEKIAKSPRRDREAACPEYGTLDVAIRSLRHPLRHLREIVGRLSRIYGVTVDETMLTEYQEEAGHRTDEDLDKAFEVLRGDETLRKMPTPAQFRVACGIPKVYRDGSRPE